MAGAQTVIDLKIDDAEIKAALKDLAAKLNDLTPFFNDGGETLLNSTRERFRSQTAPDGAPWAALSPDYRRRKKRNADKVLTLWGHLRGTLGKRADKDSLRIGTPLIYGAAHQFGRPEINLPARPFLGLSETDRADLLAALNDYLTPSP
jgi:phage virion morphogenesis protein